MMATDDGTHPIMTVLSWVGAIDDVAIDSSMYLTLDDGQFVLQSKTFSDCTCRVTAWHSNYDITTFFLVDDRIQRIRRNNESWNHISMAIYYVVHGATT